MLGGINKEDIGVDLSGIESGPDISGKNSKKMSELNGEYLDHQNFGGNDDKKGPPHKAAFKEDDDKFDLLKDIRKGKNDIKKKPTGAIKKGEDGKEGADGGEGATGEIEIVGDTPEGEGDGEEGKFMEEDTGSVASSTKSLMKHLRMLRNALYENYAPSSILNLKFYARIVFVVLLVLTAVWYGFEHEYYS